MWKRWASQAVRMQLKVRSSNMFLQLYPNKPKRIYLIWCELCRNASQTCAGPICWPGLLWHGVRSSCVKDLKIPVICTRSIRSHQTVFLFALLFPFPETLSIGPRLFDCCCCCMWLPGFQRPSCHDLITPSANPFLAYLNNASKPTDHVGTLCSCFSVLLQIKRRGGRFCGTYYIYRWVILHMGCCWA